MASREEFVQYIVDQLRDAGAVTYRKMFGEYGVYCDGKIFGVVCDDRLFIKITEAGKRLRPDMETGSPYQGARPHFIVEDVDDKEGLAEFVRETCKELPMPKPKKAKKKENG